MGVKRTDRGSHRLPLPEARAGHHRCAVAPRLARRLVERAVVDHDELVHERGGVHQLGADDPDDVANGGLFVAGWNEHVDRGVLGSFGRQEPVEAEL